MASEPERRCMYCYELHPGRSMTKHVEWKSDDAHGPRGHIPTDFDIEKCHVAGTVEIIQERGPPVEDHDRFACVACGKVCKGQRGIAVHEARSRGDLFHDSVRSEKHLKFPADERSKTVRIPNEAYKHVFELSQDETDAGWEIEVDKTLRSGREIVDTMEAELLSKMRQYFRARIDDMDDSGGIDPIETYTDVERLIAGTV